MLVTHPRPKISDLYSEMHIYYRTAIVTWTCWKMQTNVHPNTSSKWIAFLFHLPADVTWLTNSHLVWNVEFSQFLFIFFLDKYPVLLRNTSYYGVKWGVKWQFTVINEYAKATWCLNSVEICEAFCWILGVEIHAGLHTGITAQVCAYIQSNVQTLISQEFWYSSCSLLLLLEI